MKSKQEVIQEAYGEYWDGLSGAAKVCALSNNGIISPLISGCGIIPRDFITYNDMGFRPRSLKGIENNNGWIRIESEADLPTSGMKNYMYCVDGKPSVFVVNLRVLLSLSKDGIVSHYMALPYPEAPIY